MPWHCTGAGALISGMDQITQVIRDQRYSGRVRFRATITEDGIVTDPVIISPASLKDPQKVRSSLATLKFCPAVRYSRYASVEVNFDTEVRIEPTSPVGDSTRR